MTQLLHLTNAELVNAFEKAEARIRELEADMKAEEEAHAILQRGYEDRIAKAKAILEHVHSRTWYDDVKEVLAALEGK